MSTQLFRFLKLKRQDAPIPRKKNTVTGIQDRSEVESMIQRYLELAQSALKEDFVSLREEETTSA